MQYDVSPERTGLFYCKHCGNSTRFSGVDEVGWPGEPYEWDHSPGCPWLGWQEYGHLDANGEVPECTCVAVLTQPFYTKPIRDLEAAIARAIAAQLLGKQVTDAIVDYDCHSGGVSGAEIGEYTQIWCEACGDLLWAKDAAAAQSAAINQEN